MLKAPSSSGARDFGEIVINDVEQCEIGHKAINNCANTK